MVADTTAITVGHVLTKPFLAAGSAVTKFTVAIVGDDGKDNELGTVEIFNSDIKFMFDKGILSFITEKVTTTSESFDTHVKNKRFRVNDYIVANIISTNQEIRPGNVISGGSCNPSYGKVRFDVYDSLEVSAKYLGITDIPIDMVLGYIRDGVIAVH